MDKNIATELDKAMQETISLISSANESDINKVPFKGSWTAAQTARHLIKAGNGMAEMFSTEAPKANREADEKASELKEMLLDFDLKMNSPDFIVPEDKQYNKKELITGTESIRSQTVEVLRNAQLDEIPETEDDNPLKGYTKLELLHFAVYHTQRHNRQIRNILNAL
ncbi:DinB family protein [Flavobacterium coralii]|uniref:DinB family protein n=1 Tax=Flavobacterium coralii TaxID=2838017 RepID=UPI000C646C69|nr:hypothetical protein [Flavobacterium sp.]|tara:strand:+ start:16954 stop:17454 length:501 start_codon:yes stop_codon:yes gene_type:complete